MRLARTADAIDTLVDRIGQLSALAVAALVVVMAGNVLLRYGFSLGSVWAQELEWHLMSPIALIGAAYALRHGEHVRVDVLYAGFSERNKARVDLLAGLAGLAVCALVIQLSWRYVLQSWGQDEGSANPGGIPYRYVLKAFIPAGFALLALQFVAETLRSLSRLR
ncbi:TRAP transporter small permease subunit [Falsiroseomonas selenitidurans]|uniref:TRAP transporter small permease protein n=1 Tax=Falsiroseomonas selenitidurans TaxID=2716335 RepID=A0ABX1EA07_9PROT|nr:TRAP transporter small permease subunit [Falsiroseomonas selenitidurans]NKC33645.1 TRAP transporter small permease subunit [Falsiroseomonas selenitidurans]